MPPSVVEPREGPLPLEGVANGCFETMRAYGGKIFRLETHLDRLCASAAFLGTRLDPDRARLRRLLTGTLARSGLREAVVRVAMIPQPAAWAKPHVVVQPAIRPPAFAYQRGVRVAVVPSRKFAVGSITPQAKYSARLGSVLAIVDAQLRGVDEALFVDDMASVTESTASNLGLVVRGTILTPPCWLGLLAGITREVLFELAKGLRLPANESPLTRHDLYNADEVFLMSTLKEFLSVTAVDGRRIGTGRPGPIVRALRSRFHALLRRELGLRRR